MSTFIKNLPDYVSVPIKSQFPAHLVPNKARNIDRHSFEFQTGYMIHDSGGGPACLYLLPSNPTNLKRSLVKNAGASLSSFCLNGAGGWEVIFCWCWCIMHIFARSFARDRARALQALVHTQRRVGVCVNNSRWTSIFMWMVFLRPYITMTMYRWGDNRKYTIVQRYNCVIMASVGL